MTWRSDSSTGITVSAIRQRVEDEFLSSRIMDNNLRGYWCEAMLAEALGERCTICSFGWAAWDLQIGKSVDAFPSRIRIQVKNSAARQTWHRESDAPSDCLFNLSYRKRPFFFDRDNPAVPCEEVGFMCDLFALCHHSEVDLSVVDQRDPKQWNIYLVPARQGLNAITEAELRWASDRLCKAKTSNLQRRPKTMQQGIRGRRPIAPIPASKLSLDDVYEALDMMPDQKFHT